MGRGGALYQLAGLNKMGESPAVAARKRSLTGIHVRALTVTERESLPVSPRCCHCHGDLVFTLLLLLLLHSNRRVTRLCGKAYL